MSAQTDTYVQEANCINTCVPDGMKWAVLIYVMAQLAGVTTDPNTLMQASACINNCIPQGMQLAVLIYLASQITSTGGGGGGTTVTTVNPTGTAGAKGALVWNSSNKTLWVNQDGTTTGWWQIV